MSLLSGIQSSNLEFVRQTHYAEHSEGDIVFQTHASQFALQDDTTVSANWTINVLDIYGNRLPFDVLYELQVAEASLTLSQLDQFVTVKHEAVIYQIVRPSPFPPIGQTRVYRFWLSPQENV